MRVALVLLLAACDSGEARWHAWINDPPRLDTPRFDENRCLTADQVRDLDSELDAAHAWQVKAIRAMEKGRWLKAPLKLEPRRGLTGSGSK